MVESSEWRMNTETAVVSSLSRRSEQEQQRVAIGPGNAHFISIRQVSFDATATAAAAAHAAV